MENLRIGFAGKYEDTSTGLPAWLLALIISGALIVVVVAYFVIKRICC
jgi:hypothetical protein